LKFPSFSQWRQIFKVLKKRERITLLVFLALAIISFIFLVTSFYLEHTKVTPALGGTYVEGIVGQPRFINPIYGETNDVDRTLIDLVFSSLMTYDNQGNIVKDLAENYSISEDGKTYNFTLEDSVFWHDGKKLTADDIVFTIKTIQNSDYKSPLRANWIDVDVQKISEDSVRFNLKIPYNSFLENLTVKIIPKHIFESISPENFSLSFYNLQPIGSGAFAFSNLQQTETGFIKTLNLISYRKYYRSPSFIANISFQFFEKREDLVKAVKIGQIGGLTLSSFDDSQTQAQKEIGQGWQMNEKFHDYSFLMPRYFAVFFNNQKSSIFSDDSIRKALTLATNKEEIIQTVNSDTNSNALRVDSPLLSDFFGYANSSITYNFDIDAAKKLLDKAGFKDNGSGYRVKAIQKKPAFQFQGYLKVGSKNSEVAQLQSCLTRLDDTFKTILQNETSGKYTILTENAVTEFQKKYLSRTSPTGETGQATRKKLNEVCFESPDSQPLKFTITTVNKPQLIKVADVLKNYWQAIGASVDINAVSLTDLKPIIKSRNYDILLYGEALGALPDPYPFWHSSQKIDPGLNLASYENKDVDKLLKEARETLDDTIKKQKLEKAQDLIMQDAPAIFLYNPSYGYWVSGKVQGIDTSKIIDPAKRFSNITHWYIKTKRVWK